MRKRTAKPRRIGREMTNSVLDASALLAYLRREPGHDRVLTAIRAGTVMSAVNFAEVATWYMRGGADEAYIRMLRARLVFPLLTVDDDLAVRAAAIEPLTRSHGLSLADRFCLALASKLQAPAVTADKVWQRLPAIAQLSVELIR